MIETCLGSVYLSIFIWALFSKLLFFVSVYESKGNMEFMLKTMIVFDVIMLLTLPLLLMMTKGVC